MGGRLSPLRDAAMTAVVLQRVANHLRYKQTQLKLKSCGVSGQVSVLETNERREIGPVLHRPRLTLADFQSKPVMRPKWPLDRGLFDFVSIECALLTSQRPAYSGLFLWDLHGRPSLVGFSSCRHRANLELH